MVQGPDRQWGRRRFCGLFSRDSKLEQVQVGPGEVLGSLSFHGIYASYTQRQSIVSGRALMRKWQPSATVQVLGDRMLYTEQWEQEKSGYY
jgi:hypothetical protein